MEKLKWHQQFTPAETLFAARQTGLDWRDIVKSEFRGELGEEDAGFYCLTKQVIGGCSTLVRIRVTEGVKLIPWTQLHGYAHPNRLKQIRNEYHSWGEGCDGDPDRDLPEIFGISVDEYNAEEEELVC